MTALAPMPGAISGLTICTSVRSVPAPSTRADSSIFFRQVLDEAHQQPDRDRQLRRRMREDQRPQGIQHSESSRTPRTAGSRAPRSGIIRMIRSSA